MRLFAGTIALALTFAALMPAARAQLPVVEHHTIMMERVLSGSSVVPITMRLYGRFNEPPSQLCPYFESGDARVVKSVRFALVYFDESGARAGTDSFVRTGSFARGQLQSPVIHPRLEHQPDCATIHRQRHGIGTVVYYIDHLEFADGTSWSPTVAVNIPENIRQGVPGGAPAGSATAPAAPGELPPLVRGRFADCASAENAPQSQPATHNVMVDVQPGAPAGSNLFAVGSAAVCQPSGNPLHDAAAVDAVRADRVTVTGPEVLRVDFPVVDEPAACSEPARVMLRRLAPLQFRVDENAAPPGQYDVVVHVDVRPDGTPADATVVNAVGRRPYDDAARQSALNSRYWPAIINGQPALGSVDFLIGWTVTRRTSGLLQSQLTPITPPVRPAACVTRARG